MFRVLLEVLRVKALQPIPILSRDRRVASPGIDRSWSCHAVSADHMPSCSLGQLTPVSQICQVGSRVQHDARGAENQAPSAPLLIEIRASRNEIEAQHDNLIVFMWAIGTRLAAGPLRDADSHVRVYVIEAPVAPSRGSDKTSKAPINLLSTSVLQSQHYRRTTRPRE